MIQEDPDQIPISLKFITDDPDEQELCRAYWRARRGPGVTFKWPETVEGVAGRFRVPRSKLAERVFDLVVATVGPCMKCEKPVRVRTRSDWQKAATWGDLVCPACAELRRQQAAELAEQMDQEKSDILTRRFPGPAPVAFGELSLKDCVYLLAAFRATDLPDSAGVGPVTALGAAAPELAPWYGLQLEIIQHLRDRHLIEPSPDSRFDAFDFQYAGGAITGADVLDPLYCRYRIAPARSGELPLVAQIAYVFREGEWLEGWSNEVVPLWRCLALYEGLEYFYYLLDKYRIRSNTTNHIAGVLEDATEEFSIRDTWRMMRRAVRDAVVFMHRTDTPDEIGQKYAARRLDRLLLRSIGKSNFAPNWKGPEGFGNSAISNVLFGDVLRIGVAGYTTVPQWPIRER